MTGVLTWLAVALLGGAGAVLRVLVDAGARNAFSRVGGESIADAPDSHDFPVGTLLVNTTGAFAAGVLAGAALGSTAALLAATAFVGAYSTFSTLMLDVADAVLARQRVIAAANLLGSLLLGGLAAAAGLAVGRLL